MAIDHDEGLRQRRLVFWHEIKSPVATLKTLLDVLADGSAGELPESARDLVDRARRQAGRVNEMIAAAHDLERLQGGRLAFSDSRIDLREALAVALKSIESAAAAKKVTFALQDGEAMPTRADPAQVARCLEALARSALECAHRESSVNAQASQIDGGILVVLRVEALSSKDVLEDALGPTCPLGLRGGNGIGLHEAQLFIEAMGGRVRVSVEAERATLEVWLPAR